VFDSGGNCRAIAALRPAWKRSRRTLLLASGERRGHLVGLVRLSPTEFKLLRYLLLNAERVLSKAQILDHVWQYDFDGKSGVVENYISYLRKKIDSVEPPLIHTVRGFGYVLRAEP
jgi:DNA-binding response OmpR family regulator